MTATQDDTIAELQRANAELRRERDAALSERATLAEELAARDAALALRNSEFGERIEQQSATIDVLKVMSASPGDPQPVFDLIVERARDLCDAYGATVYEYDGTLIYFRAATGISDDATVREQVAAMFPMPPTRYSGAGRAILDRRINRIDDLEADTGLHPALRRQTAKSAVALPLLRGGVAVGALALGSRERGGFSASQIDLLKTFAEQAVIAITSAETYRALQQRTGDLRESLEYQTATSDVLKVISRSTFDLEPVLERLLRTAALLCDADLGSIAIREGDTYRMAANYSPVTPEYDAYFRNRQMPADRGSVTGRTVLEGRIIHVVDVMSDPEFALTEVVKHGGARTVLGVPLLREGDVAGVIILGRKPVQPFTDRQIELVSTFADQAVIAIENTRLLTEQREALEQQTATAEVLQVINSSPGDLAPVFDAMLEKAMRLCGAAFGMLRSFDGEQMHTLATRGVPLAFAEYSARNALTPMPTTGPARALETGRPAQTMDITEGVGYQSGEPGARALADLGGARTILHIPLFKDQTPVGLFSFYRQEVRAFTGTQIALLENFAAQAVIAIENTRLIDEQREALEQQTATAEVLQVINASPGHLQPVFDVILEKAVRLCAASLGVLHRYDGAAMQPRQPADHQTDGCRAANSPSWSIQEPRWSACCTANL